MSPHTTHKNMVAVFGDNKFAALADEQDVMDAYEQVQRLKQLAEDRIWQAKAVPSIFIVEDDEDDDGDNGEWTVVRGKRGPQVYEVVREDDTEYVEDVEDTYAEKDTYKSLTGSFTCDCSECNSDNDTRNDPLDDDWEDDLWWWSYSDSYNRDRINAIDDGLEDPYDYNPYYYQYTDLRRSPCETCKYYYSGQCPNCEYLEQDYIPLVDPEDLEDEYFESYFDDEDYFDDPDDFVIGGSRKGAYLKREKRKVENKCKGVFKDRDTDKVDVKNNKSGTKWTIAKDEDARIIYRLERNKIWHSRPKYWRRMRATRQSFREHVEELEAAVLETEAYDMNYDYYTYECICGDCYECGYYDYRDDYFDDDWW